MTDGNRDFPGVSGAPDPGLCGSCRHSRRMESDRGSIFYQCQLAFQDDCFDKYPRLPVLECDGYAVEETAGESV
jgi:hypothetical protein